MSKYAMQLPKYIMDAKEFIDEKPKINVAKPKKGKWIKNNCYEDALMCSCCKAYLDKEDWSRHYFYYCYHCGALMEEMDCGADIREEKES